MSKVFIALTAASKDLLHPKMLALVLWPMIAAVIIWGGLTLVFWNEWWTQAANALASLGAKAWLDQWGITWLAASIVTIFLVLLLLPIIYITALVIVSLFIMPIMVKHVAARYYPELEKKHGGTTWGSLWNGMAAVFIYLLLWILTLPLWLFPLFTPIIPTLLFAYLNQRIFRYDALAEHASQAEFGQILEQSTGQLYLLGTILALLHFIPILNLFTPTFIGLAFIHFCLARLQSMRADKLEIENSGSGT